MSYKPARHRAFLYIGIIFIVIFVFAFQKIRNINALSLGFVQTDWSTPDTNATANSSDLNNWTKYYSATSGVTASISGELRLKVEVTSP